MRRAEDSEAQLLNPGRGCNQMLTPEVIAKSGVGHVHGVASLGDAHVPPPSAPCIAQGPKNVRARGGSSTTLERVPGRVAQLVGWPADGSARRVQPGGETRESGVPGGDGKARRGRARTLHAQSRIDPRKVVGGVRGIRTLDTGLSPYNALAGRPLRPLGHHSGGTRIIAYSACRSQTTRIVWGLP